MSADNNEVQDPVPKVREELFADPLAAIQYALSETLDDGEAVLFLQCWMRQDASFWPDFDGKRKPA